jgi:hypothetical protein
MQTFRQSTLAVLGAILADTSMENADFLAADFTQAQGKTSVNALLSGSAGLFAGRGECAPEDRALTA